MTKRLDRLRSELTLHMVRVLCDKDSSVQSSLEQLIKALKSLEIDIGDELGRMRHDIFETLESTQNLVLKVGSDLSSKIDALWRRTIEAKKYKSILESLHYEEMPMRYIQIPEAYDKTNAWIFKKEGSSFRDWLRTSSGVFWISGKAGSGKSTLVKYLADSKETRELLKEWAYTPISSDVNHDRNLAVVSYYFWKSGYPIQKSLRGLYRCLLYRIFQQCPSFIRAACSKRWQALDDPSARMEPWTQEDLTAVLHTLIKIDVWPSCFCFFIDGLDEYAGTANEQYSMIQDLNHLVKCRYVKIAVSSRPWNVFQSAYGQDPKKMIVLSNHNQADLDLYITGKLINDARYRRLAASDHRAAEFALEIRQRANGVFLWVFLVVTSLLDGLTEEDDIEMLQWRLRQLPPTLEQYFELMLKSIDPVYKQYTARAFLLACNAAQPLPTLTYYWLTKELSDPDYALILPVEATSTHEAATRQAAVRTRVNKWCRDLLEVVPKCDAPQIEDYTVQFIHRTARDYLVGDEAKSLFAKDAGQDFNPRLSICRSYLANAKTIPPWILGRSLETEFDKIAHCMVSQAKKCRLVDGFTPFNLVRELDRACPVVADVKSTGGQNGDGLYSMMLRGDSKSHYLPYRQHPTLVRKAPDDADYAEKPSKMARMQRDSDCLHQSKDANE